MRGLWASSKGGTQLAYDRGLPMRRAVAIAIAALCLTPAAVHGQQVVAGHPRIYLRPADLPALRTRVTQAPISTYYTQMRSRMDGSSARHSNNEVAGFELESLALLHAIAGGTTYRDKILNVWRFSSYTPGQITHWDLPYQVMGHALALDYLWNDISPAQRTELGNVIVAMMDDLYNYAPYNVSFANQMSDYSNQLYYHLGALAFAGIVLAGEGINDARAQFYLSEAAILLNDHMIPAMNQEAGGDADLPRRSGFVGNGGWGEDMGHLDMTHPLFGRMVEAWRTGVGENLFPAINGLARYLAVRRVHAPTGRPAVAEGQQQLPGRDERQELRNARLTAERAVWRPARQVRQGCRVRRPDVRLSSVGRDPLVQPVAFRAGVFEHAEGDALPGTG